MALFPEHHSVAINNEDVVQIRLKDVELHRPRQWGACWLSCRLYKQLGLDKFWLERLPPSRRGKSTWAPPENDASTAKYLATLKRLFEAGQ